MHLARRTTNMQTGAAAAAAAAVAAKHVLTYVGLYVALTRSFFLQWLDIQTIIRCLKSPWSLFYGENRGTIFMFLVPK